MRRITFWTLSTITIVVLLFSYRTSTSSRAATSVVAAGTIGGDVAANGGSSTDQQDPPQGSTPSSTPTPSASSGSAAGNGTSSPAKTFTGDAVQTRFGPVQVEITVTAGKVTRSVVTQVPWNDPRDQEINAYAVPILNQEAVQAQSASIDMVSGATYTSDGYLQSLQSAIDQAKL